MFEDVRIVIVINITTFWAVAIQTFTVMDTRNATILSFLAIFIGTFLKPLTVMCHRHVIQSTQHISDVSVAEAK